MLFLLHRPFKGSRNIQDLALIRAVLLQFKKNHVHFVQNHLGPQILESAAIRCNEPRTARIRPTLMTSDKNNLKTEIDL